jgi:valyl-tRNA synthetase
MLASLQATIDEATAAFDDYDYARALERIESFFWWFCDDYLELVKVRATSADDAGSRSARVALRMALDVLHRLFAPFIPFVTDEVWSWWRTGSVHRASWPTETPRRADGDASLLGPVSDVLGAVRRAKTEAKVSQRHAVDCAKVTGPAVSIAAVEAARRDLIAAGTISELITEVGNDAADQVLHCHITLADMTAST